MGPRSDISLLNCSQRVFSSPIKFKKSADMYISCMNFPDMRR